jgi:hypothetical protein
VSHDDTRGLVGWWGARGANRRLPPATTSAGTFLGWPQAVAGRRAAGGLQAVAAGRLLFSCQGATAAVLSAVIWRASGGRTREFRVLRAAD